MAGPCIGRHLRERTMHDWEPPRTAAHRNETLGRLPAALRVRIPTGAAREIEKEGNGLRDGNRRGPRLNGPDPVDCPITTRPCTVRALRIRAPRGVKLTAPPWCSRTAPPSHTRADRRTAPRPACPSSRERTIVTLRALKWVITLMVTDEIPVGESHVCRAAHFGCSGNDDPRRSSIQ